MTLSMDKLLGRKEPGVKGEALGEHKMTPAEEAWDLVKTMFYAILIALVVRVLIFQPFNIPSGSMKPTLLVGDFIVVSKPAYGYSRASLVWPLTRLPVDGRLDPWGATPKRGDIIVFKNRKDGNKDYIKRTIGLPGDKIQMIDGLLYINDKPVQRELLGDAVKECGASHRYAKKYRETLPNGVSYTTFECDDNSGELDDTARQFRNYARSYPGAYPVNGDNAFHVPAGHLFMMGDNRDDSRDSRVLTAVGYVPMEDVVGKAERLVFSADGAKAHFWQVWKWPQAIRYNRIFASVK